MTDTTERPRVLLRDHAWATLPDIKSQLPVWFEGGNALEDLSLSCAECDTPIAPDNFRGAFSRPIPTVVNISGWGYCTCGCLTPFTRRFRGPKLTMEWQMPQGWVKADTGKNPGWLRRLLSRKVQKPASLSALLDSIPTEAARTLARSSWLGVVEAELHGRKMLDLVADTDQPDAGAILLHGRDGSHVWIGVDASAGDEGISVGPLRLSVVLPEDRDPFMAQFPALDATLSEQMVAHRTRWLAQFKAADVTANSFWPS